MRPSRGVEEGAEQRGFGARIACGARVDAEKFLFDRCAEPLAIAFDERCEKIKGGGEGAFDRLGEAERELPIACVARDRSGRSLGKGVFEMGA